MSKLTEILKLFCYDPATDGANTFNIPKALNENWEKIDAALAPLGGATTAQAALAALGAGVRPNLLDNGIFVGANLPVNQRGETSWESYGYHIDRWFCEGNVAGSVDDQGFHIASGQTVIQKVDEVTRDYLLGKTVTVSILLSDGNFGTETGTLPDTLTKNFDITCYPKSGFLYSLTFFYQAQSYQVGRIANNSEQEVTVVACKAELGTTQTLAYQDEDGTWRLLPQPESDYAAQLAKCQSTLLHLGGEIAIRASYANSTGIWFFVPIPVTLRSLPVIIGTLAIRTVDGGTVYNDYTFNCENFSDNGVFVRAIKAGGNTLTDAVLIGDAYLSAEF